jgi:hypothetical protein
MSICEKSTEEDLIGGAQLDYRNSRSFRAALLLKRIAVLLIFIIAQQYSKYKMKTRPNTAILLLPAYCEFVYWLLATNILFALINVVATFSSSFNTANAIFGIIDILIGVFFSWFLFVFYMQSGAGVKDMIKAAKYSVFVSALVFIDVFVAYSFKSGGHIRAGFITLAFASCVTLMFFSAVLLLPESIVYKRPAFRPLCISLICSVTWILFNNLTGYYRVDYSSCSIFAYIFVYEGVVSPFAILYSLYIDSNVRICVTVSLKIANNLSVCYYSVLARHAKH